MIKRFIGDVHGKFARYKSILANSPYPTHQVGDMGVGFRKWPHGEWSANPPFDLMAASGATFHRGNHDNPEVCRAHRLCIPDGTVIDNAMFVGGALSIDKAYRYPGFSWWEDEELSSPELKRMSEIFVVARPEIMVTHECPEHIAQELIMGLANPTPGQKFKMDPRMGSRTREWFMTMHGDHQPKLWVFGHWHVPFDRVVEGTRFICLSELETIDVDMDKAEIVGERKSGKDKTWGLS